MEFEFYEISFIWNWVLYFIHKFHECIFVCWAYFVLRKTIWSLICQGNSLYFWSLWVGLIMQVYFLFTTLNNKCPKISHTKVSEKNGICKLCTPISDCSWSLIRIYTVYHSTKYFKKLHKKQNLGKKKNKKKKNNKRKRYEIKCLKF